MNIDGYKRDCGFVFVLLCIIGFCQKISAEPNHLEPNLPIQKIHKSQPVLLQKQPNVKTDNKHCIID
jgi:hypothetical protein